MGTRQVASTPIKKSDKTMLPAQRLTLAHSGTDTCPGMTVTGRRPLPDPVPVEAELRRLSRETLDPGEVGPRELPLERPGCLLVTPFEGEESTLHLPEIDEVVRGKHLALDDGESRCFRPYPLVGAGSCEASGWRGGPRRGSHEESSSCCLPRPGVQVPGRLRAAMRRVRKVI